MRLPAAIAVEGGGEIPRTFAQEHFNAQSVEPFANYVANARYAESLGVPFVERQEPHGRKLAVVGAGPSLAAYVHALNEWDGDIWAINGAWDFLKSQGIAATFFAVDPQELVAQYKPDRAILGACVHPKVFDQLKGGDVRAFYPAGMEPEGYAGLVIHGGCSAAVYTPLLALWKGYRDVTLFGCEGSLSGDPDRGGVTHVNEHEAQSDVIALVCGGERFWIKPDLLLQCERLAAILRLSPQIFREQSGGLLRAMVTNGLKYEVIGASERLFAKLWPSAA
jgi:hypothetical protein